MYRVNFGNGQVQEGFKTVKDARTFIASLDAYRGLAFVQRKEGGEWFHVRDAR